MGGVSLLGLAALSIGGPLLAVWAHEAVHALAAWAFGGEVLAIDWWRLETYFRFAEPSPIRERLVLLAPAIVGLAVAPVLLLAWDGGVGAVEFVAALSWSIFSLNGGVEGEVQLSEALRLHRHLP